MKLTKNSTKTEVESTELVCEITQDEFVKLGAKAAADTIAQMIGDEPEMEDFLYALTMTKVFAHYVTNISKLMFNDPDTTENENPDKKEEN